MEDNEVIVISDSEDDERESPGVRIVKQDPTIQRMIQRCIQEIMNEPPSQQFIHFKPKKSEPILLNGRTSALINEKPIIVNSSVANKNPCIYTKSNNDLLLHVDVSNSIYTASINNGNSSSGKAECSKTKECKTKVIKETEKTKVQNETDQESGQVESSKISENREVIKETENAKIQNKTNKQKESLPPKNNKQLIPFDCLNYFSNQKRPMNSLNHECIGFYQYEVMRDSKCPKKMKRLNRFRKLNLKKLLNKNIKYLKSVKMKLRNTPVKNTNAPLKSTKSNLQLESQQTSVIPTEYIIDENNFGESSRYYIDENFSNIKLIYKNTDSIVTNLYMDYFPLFKQAVKNNRIQVVKKLRNFKLSRAFQNQKRSKFCKVVNNFHLRTEKYMLIRNIMEEHNYSSAKITIL